VKNSLKNAFLKKQIADDYRQQIPALHGVRLYRKPVHVSCWLTGQSLPGQRREQSQMVCASAVLFASLFAALVCWHLCLLDVLSVRTYFSFL
jgi:hypothetical protein